MVFWKGRILLGYSSLRHYKGWVLPGGHLEFGESFADCAKRELMEEASLKTGTMKYFGTANEILKNGRHFVMITLVAQAKSSKVKELEPKAFGTPKWFNLEDMPSDIFPETKQTIRSYLLKDSTSNR
jgi:8-oxo-dGTP diphosphatase